MSDREIIQFGDVYITYEGDPATEEEITEFKNRQNKYKEILKLDSEKKEENNKRISRIINYALFKFFKDVDHLSAKQARVEIKEHFYEDFTDLGDLIYQMTTMLFDCHGCFADYRNDRDWDAYFEAQRKYFGDDIHIAILEGYLKGEHDT